MNALRIASMLLLVAALGGIGGGCGSDTPVPDYPFPETRPLEETDLAEYVAGDEEEIEEEEWDDGLDDEDMMMEAPAEETDAE